MTDRTGVILYGPPAAGKDTVTAALHEQDGRITLYQRLKIGPGRTEGYRMATLGELEELRAAGGVIYSNERYDATYVIDQPELSAMFAAGKIPVLHAGQLETIDAIRQAEPTARWIVVELWCSRATADIRIAARGTGDIAARMRAWDETPQAISPHLRIDTEVHSPEAAAQRILTQIGLSWIVVVPALHMVDSDGQLDLKTTRRYAETAAAGWIDRFLINGSTTSGQLLSEDERSAVLDVWLNVVPAQRLLACTWGPQDIAAAKIRHVTPMAVMRAENLADARRFLTEIGPGSTIYSHPMFGQTFTPELATWARTDGYLPVGGKLAKAQPAEISAITRQAPEFQLWDGSSRHLRESITSGAAGVVATPLTAQFADLPPKEIDQLQPVIDDIQNALDQLPTRDQKRDWLREQLR